MLKVKLKLLKHVTRNIPNLRIQTNKDLLTYCLRKNLIEFSYKDLKHSINYLFNRNELTVEQWETLNSAINSGDYSRVQNNKKIKKLIEIIK